MSIKIHTAYRVPISRLPEAIALIHESQWKLASETLCSLRGKQDFKYIRESIKSNHQDSEWVLGFNVWLDDSHGYIIPFSPMGLDPIPDWFEDYHYQNQVDDKEWEIDPEGYEARRHKFEEIGVLDFNRTLTHHTIGSVEDVYRLEIEFFQEER